MAEPTLTSSQLQALKILISRHPSPTTLSESNGHNRISLSIGQTLLDLGFVRFVEQFYPSAWVAMLTATGLQQAKVQGVVK
jgi:hypothetical protein